MVQLIFTVYYGILRNQIVHIHGVEYRIAETSRVENFVIIVEGFQPFLIFTGASFDVAAVLDPPLIHWDGS